MPVCHSQIKYMLTIRELQSSSKDTVRGVDISNYLGVTRSSVSKMLKCLSHSDIVHDNVVDGVRFTEYGYDLAEEYYRPYRYVYLFFNRMLKIPIEDAKLQAMEFVANFPKETSTKFSVIIKNTLNRRENKERSQ